jgi:hypothetical protein
MNLPYAKGNRMDISNRMVARSPTRFRHHSMNAALLLAAGLFAALLAPAAAAENFGTEIANAFADGEFDVNFRYRYEYVDQQYRALRDPNSGQQVPFTKNANASTLRTRLVYKSGEYKNLFVTLNMDDVRSVVANNYNSTRNGKRQYPVVGDPKGTDLNLASLTYTGLEDGTIVLGRQRIIRGNHRFIGNVGWRQNEQTYDSASIDYAFTEKFQAFYSYVDRVKRIFGPDSGVPAASFSSNSHLIDASYAFTPLFKLTGYAYLLDLTEANNPAPTLNPDRLSSQTLGLRLAGSHKFGGDLKFSYAAEYASQQDYKDNPNNYDEGYYVAEGGLDWAKFGLKLGYEVLEGSGTAGESFQTPLSTLHKFNGWADMFLVTPGGGLKDLYVEGSARALGGKFSLIYHDFSAQTGGSNYGSELDFVASWSFLENYSVLAKFAVFEVDSNTSIAAHSDISKAWLMLTAAF